MEFPSYSLWGAALQTSAVGASVRGTRSLIAIVFVKLPAAALKDSCGV